jgi:enterochelin esterase-like enzyme
MAGIGGPGGGNYGRFMISDLIPWVDSHFRTIADKDHRAMAGLSMGSMQTVAVTMANLDKFSYIGLFSGGTGAPRRAAAQPGATNPPPAPAEFNIKTAYNGAMADPADFNQKVKAFFFSCGGEENPDGLMKHQEVLKAAGITNSYAYVSPGTAHEWQTWRRSLYGFAQLLFQ